MYFINSYYATLLINRDNSIFNMTFFYDFLYPIFADEKIWIGLLI